MFVKIIGGLKTETQLPLWEGEKTEQSYKPKHRIIVGLTARLVALIWSFKHRFHVFYLRWCLSRGHLSLLNEFAVCGCSKYTRQWWFALQSAYCVMPSHDPPPPFICDHKFPGYCTFYNFKYFQVFSSISASPFFLFVSCPLHQIPQVELHHF